MDLEIVEQALTFLSAEFRGGPVGALTRLQPLGIWINSAFGILSCVVLTLAIWAGGSPFRFFHRQENQRHRLVSPFDAAGIEHQPFAPNARKLLVDQKILEPRVGGQNLL